MKKHLILIALATVLIVLATGGTVAYFTKEFSNNGTIAAATFDVDVVDSGGTTIGGAEINIDQKLYPGMETIELYNFSINKNNTEVPMEYSIVVNPNGDLFPADDSSPVKVSLERNVDGEWVDLTLSPDAFQPKNDVEDFRILVNWPHSDNDTPFQALTGQVDLEVVATQIDDDAVENPDDPEEPEGPPYYTGDVIFKATPNGSTRTTTNKEVNFYLNDDGYKVIEIKMGDGEGHFEEKVGNIRVVESVEGANTWYRVYTDNEYYASESQMWRTKSVDTSTEGVLYFDKTLKPYLSIQSKELYDWFLAN